MLFPTQHLLRRDRRFPLHLGRSPAELPVFLSVGQDNFGYDLAAVEAAKKKHEAIETDTAAYKERVQALEDLAQELEKENYHDQKRITARKDNILRLWSYLQELLASRRQRLETTLALQKLFQDMLHSIDWMDEIKVGPALPFPRLQHAPWASVPVLQLAHASLHTLPTNHVPESEWRTGCSAVSGCICLSTAWPTLLQKANSPGPLCPQDQEILGS